ncbi:MAG: hypothetical protein Q9174_001539 [Haloplaca sp. 1 TL-2023]
MSAMENEAMSTATRCVRRFAPNGKRRMGRTDNGHITACKISDANPNELIASWSGDHIYSFDIMRSPDAADEEALRSNVAEKSGKRSKATADKKRKRKQGQNSTSSDGLRRLSRSRRTGSQTEEASDLALRVRYENGQSEDIAVDDPLVAVSNSQAEEARESLLDDFQQRSLRIAKSLVKIRKLLFSMEDIGTTYDVSNRALKTRFTSIFGFSASVLPEMDEVSRSWRYPLDPREEDVVFQQTLRSHRDSSRRFIQAAGSLAKALGGRLQTAGGGSGTLDRYFEQIAPGPHEGPSPASKEIFSLDFLKAILLWLSGGPQMLLQGFKTSPQQRKDHPRFPIPEDTDHEGIHDYLIPYLLRMASSGSIPNVDASRFERDESRQTFQSETSAVIAFSNAVRMPLKDLSRAIMPAGEDSATREAPVAQDTKAAMKFWGFKVGRGLLMNAGEGVNFQYVDIAFGGLGTGRANEGRVQDDIDPDEMEDVVENISLVQRQPTEESHVSHGDQAMPPVPNGDGGDPATGPDSMSREASLYFEDAGSDADVVLMDDLHNEIGERMAEHYEYENEATDGEEDENTDDEEDDDGLGDEDAGDSDQDITDEERQFVFRLASDRGKSRESVEADVPYSSHTRMYSGHCNIKTVKDANFFGLNDEYVVSGSDGGYLFIWDKKTSELVNILQGDGEVVNVVQGVCYCFRNLYSYLHHNLTNLQHPFEPVLAVSGIDSTVKIFSPDNRAQEDARAGINVGYPSQGFTIHSSLSGRRRRARHRAASESDDEDSSQGSGLASCKRMDRREEIVRENDLQRQGGMREAFITVRNTGPFQRLQRMEVGFAEWLSWFDDG